MNYFMSPYFVLSYKSFSTKAALVGPLSSVNLFMLLHGSFGKKFLPTSCACKVTNTGVRHHVSCQFISSWETLGTMITLIFIIFFINMDRIQVVGERAFAVKAL